MFQGIHNYLGPTQTYFDPCELLRPFIACYWGTGDWQDKNKDLSKASEPHWDTVVPDACTDILFDIDKESRSSNVIFCGMFDEPFYVYHSGEISNYTKELFAIRFFPGGIYPFLKQSLNAFNNKIVDINEVWSEIVSELAEKIMAVCSFTERISIVETFLLKKYFNFNNSNYFRNDTLANLLYKIVKTKGLITINELAQEEIVSIRQINRNFEKWIGLNPKTFSMVIRFQNILLDIEKSKAIDWQYLSYKYNFYDQSHFIKQFKKFYGTKPSLFLKEDMSDFYYK
jgi:AraC-like DNA-binding protein